MSWFRRRNRQPYDWYNTYARIPLPAPPSGHGVSIKRNHAWEPPVPCRFELVGPGVMANVDEITFGPWVDTENPQVVSWFSVGGVAVGMLRETLRVPSGGYLTFRAGSLNITLT